MRAINRVRAIFSTKLDNLRISDPAAVSDPHPMQFKYRTWPVNLFHCSCLILV